MGNEQITKKNLKLRRNYMLRRAWKILQITSTRIIPSMVESSFEASFLNSQYSLAHSH